MFVPVKYQSRVETIVIDKPIAYNATEYFMAVKRLKVKNIFIHH